MRAHRAGRRMDGQLHSTPGWKATVASSRLTPLEALPAALPTSGGAAAQVTRNGGFIAQESLDGKSLYVWVEASEGGAIWKMPVAGGETVPVIQGVRYWAWWSVARNGIYYVDGSTPSTNLRFSDFASQRTRSITAIDFGYSYWIPGAQYFDLSSDGRWILFDRGEQVDSDIMLVEHFH